jgi:hypothetical protein
MAGKSLKSIRRRKFVKTVKKRVPWLGHVINDEVTAGEFNLSELNVVPRNGSLCLACRGGRRLCGKPRCPALIKLYPLLNIRKRMRLDQLDGSSPPGVFVGRMGYPHVYAGPLVPPMLGETSHFCAPEEWLGRSVDEIVNFRTSLIRGKFRVNVTKPFENDRFLNRTIEMALSKVPVDTELTFKKKPSNRIFLDGTLQPMGPSAILKNMKVGSGKTDRRIEKAYSDHDLKAEQAILNLYLSDVPVSKIQRVFSVGALGIKQQRRMVPTRWSITNPHSQSIALSGDWEGYRGRTTYASNGGCYYSVRLAVAEFLAKEHRQASVIAMREIYPSFLLPLGVWINRECMREAFHQTEYKFNTLHESLDYIGTRFAIPMEDWIEASSLLKDSIQQKRIIDYV